MKLNQCRNCRREVEYSLIPNKGRCNSCHTKRKERMGELSYELQDAVKCGVDGEYYYQGYVYDNPAFEDGTYIHTSRVVEEIIGPNTGKVVQIKTLNSVYDLN